MRMEFCKSWHYGNWTVKKMCYIEIDALHLNKKVFYMMR